LGFKGLEIAPTRIFEDKPYQKLEDAEKFAKNLKDKYDLSISSMQSIWFGRSESIFGTKEERNELIEYTKNAMDFANRINCKNLVFGCPKNRCMEDKSQYNIAKDFFFILGEYAKSVNTILSIEPNPIIYGTNFVNRTEEAFKLAKDVNSDGVKVNIDLGTIIENKEDLKLISENIDLVNHIHISEPYLAQIQKRDLHNELASILKKCNYNKFVSIEMKNLENIELVKDTMIYIREVLNGI